MHQAPSGTRPGACTGLASTSNASVRASCRIRPQIPILLHALPASRASKWGLCQVVQRRAARPHRPCAGSGQRPFSPNAGGQRPFSPDERGPSPEDLSSDDEPEEGANGGNQLQPNSLQHLVLEAPLQFAATMSQANDHYLMVRRRRRWWSRSKWPQVPLEREKELPEPPQQLWQKVLPLGLVFFCASFNLTILQTLKDAIMVTAAGAETLPFLASLCVLPASIGFFVLYGKLVSALPERAVFYAAVLPLLAFYAFFAAVLFPAAPALHPLAAMEAAAQHVPVGLHGLLKVVGHWTYSLFFCSAELWGSVVISVLFWSLANEVCSIDEAKSVYPLMGISANIALCAAGAYMKTTSKTLVQSNQHANLQLMIGTVLALSGVMFAAKAYIDRTVLQPAAERAAALEATQAGSAGAAKRPAKKKSKGSFAESLAVLQNSSKIRNLALLVMCYGIGHRLFEFSWKSQLRALYPSIQAYQSILADVSTATGVTTLVMMLSSRFVFQYLGWGFAATVTPALILITGVAFFASSVVTQSSLVPAEMALSLAGLGAAAGCVTQVFARASKYSLFDPAKEMVYIEMSKEEKSRGKAAVDLVGSQIGKSGASWVTQAFLLITGSMTAALPFISVFFVATVATWIRATASLHTQMAKTEAERAAVKAEAAAAAKATKAAEYEQQQRAAAIMQSEPSDSSGAGLHAGIILGPEAGANGAWAEAQNGRRPTGDVSAAAGARAA